MMDQKRWRYMGLALASSLAMGCQLSEPAAVSSVERAAPMQRPATDASSTMQLDVNVPDSYQGDSGLRLDFVFPERAYTIQAVPTGIARLTVTLKSAGAFVAAAQVSASQIATGHASVEFKALKAGNYTIEVVAFDKNDVMIGNSTSPASVEPGRILTVQTQLKLNPAPARSNEGTGGLSVAIAVESSATALPPPSPVLPPLFVNGMRQTRVSPKEGPTKVPFPHLMGMNVGAKNYNDPAYQRDLAKLDYVILGFYRGWGGTSSAAIRAAVRAIKQRNPKMLIGQYTILSEAFNNGDAANKDIQDKINQENWWARNSAGSLVQWTTAFSAWEVNFTRGAKPDAAGERYPQWLADRNFRVFFKPVPEFDIWYFDNVFQQSRVRADYNRDGRDDDPSDAANSRAIRLGHADEWARAKQLDPNAITMGNVDNDLATPEYKQKLQGAFLECQMGKSWSIEAREGWPAMMARYHACVENTALPKLVGFHIEGSPTDYRFFRYGFASSLMDNGYFAFSNASQGYSSVPWFDEYNVDLGLAIDGPQTKAWQKGVYRRAFDKGLALVNPTSTSVTVDVGPGYKRIMGTQDPATNTGQPARIVTLRAKDGLVLLRAT